MKVLKEGTTMNGQLILMAEAMVYAGGTLSEVKLKELGLTKKDVIGRLVISVNKLGRGTRLDEDAEAEEGPWKYFKYP